MPFIGNQPALSYTSFAKQDFTTSATTSYTLDNPVANANELALFINFVRQEPTTAYTASGTSLTLTSATSASDDMYCVFLGKAVQTVNPPSGSVGLSQLSATGTPSSSTFLRGDNTFASAGITMAQMWRINASTTATSTLTDLTANWEIADTSPTGTLGTGLTESSGIFSFPSTGYYWVGCTVGFRNNNGTRNASIQLRATTNNSTYASVAIGECNNSDFGGAENTSMSAFTQYMFDITDTANQKFKLSVAADQNQTVDGSTSSQYTGFQIIRLGDT